jgi:low temperature requirement protein LtrA
MPNEVGTTLLRRRDAANDARVTNEELFFDLVFAFAVTQTSHRLLTGLTPLGAAQTGILFLGVWWVWIDTTWVTNWLDPARTPTRLLLFAIMLAGLVMSAALPEAFGPRGLGFAVAYAAIQVGRSLFTIWGIGNASPANRRNFIRISVWLSVSGVVWVAGGLMAADRLALWVAAISIEYAAPAAGFWVPGLGRSVTQDWDVAGSHIAERCSQFVIIVLGESLLSAGATFEGAAWTLPCYAALAAAFVASAAMWWMYFDTAVERGARRITASDDPGRVARLAYTYAHLPIVAGVVVQAVADDLVLARPGAAMGPAGEAVILAGPLLYVVGNLLFKRAVAGRTPLSHLVGLGLLLAVALAVGRHVPGLALGAATACVLVVVAVWEARSLGRREARPGALALDPVVRSTLDPVVRSTLSRDGA